MDNSIRSVSPIFPSYNACKVSSKAEFDHVLVSFWFDQILESEFDQTSRFDHS